MTIDKYIEYYKRMKKTSGRLFNFFQVEDGRYIGVLRHNEHGAKATIWKETAFRWDPLKHQKEKYETGYVLMKVGPEILQKIQALCELKCWKNLVVEKYNPF